MNQRSGLPSPIVGIRARFLLTVEGDEQRVQPISPEHNVFTFDDLVKDITEGMGGILCDIETVARIASACADRFKAEARKHLSVVR